MMQSLYEVPGGPAGSLYAVLGVAPGASQETVVHAYRQQARASHPDARPDDPGAAARFKMLTDAYEVLSDPLRRANYDRAQRVGGVARPVPQSGGYRPGKEGLENTGEPRVGGRSSPDVFLDARPPRPSWSLLWAGPVRVESLPSATFAELRWPQASRRRELDGLTSLLLGILTDGWPT
jgi:curved DNA-binding protein CbpA